MLRRFERMYAWSRCLTTVRHACKKFATRNGDMTSVHVTDWRTGPSRGATEPSVRLGFRR